MPSFIGHAQLQKIHICARDILYARLRRTCIIVIVAVCSGQDTAEFISLDLYSSWGLHLVNISRARYKAIDRQPYLRKW